VFGLNRNKQKNNRNSVIESIFWYFITKFRIVSVCFGLFQNSLFRLFQFCTKTESFDVSIEPKQTEDQMKQFDREHILVFFRKFLVVSVCVGFFRNNSVCFSCFDIGSKHRNKPKQTEIFCFWFHKTNRNTTETDLVSFCFGSNRNYFLFVSRTLYLLGTRDNLRA
jgi:hypothetical protein